MQDVIGRSGQRNLLARLGLGTAQLGLDYGITNQYGRPDRAEAAAILSLAATAGFAFLDTAPAYGDSEAVIGELRPLDAGFRIITKTPPPDEGSGASEIADALAAAARRSADRLKVDVLDGLLVHGAELLSGDTGPAVIEALDELRLSGLARKIGVSLYTPAQVDQVLARWQPDIVQAPFNLLDQRLATSGIVAELDARSIEMHIRSVFLQGILVANPDNLPAYFAPLRPRLRDIARAARELGLDPLQICLAAAFAQPGVHVLVGAATAAELGQIVRAVEMLPRELPELTDFAMDDDAYLNPSNWRLDAA